VQPAYTSAADTATLPGEDLLTKMMTDIISLATETTQMISDFKD